MALKRFLCETGYAVGRLWLKSVDGDNPRPRLGDENTQNKMQETGHIKPSKRFNKSREQGTDTKAGAGGTVTA